MKKVLIFSTAYYPFVGGAEVAIKEITDRAPKDFEFDIITGKLQKGLSNSEKIGRVNVYRVGVGRPLFDKLLLPFRGAFLAAKLNKKNNYFCMWGMMATFATGAGYLLNIYSKLIGRKKIPIILTLQEGDSESHLKYRWGGLIALSWRLALMQTDILTGISNFLLNRAKKSGYKGESILVPNGVDLKLFSRVIPEKTKNEIKIKLGKKEGDIFLVTDGRLTHKNALDDVVSALAHLPQNVSFVIIGKGDKGPELQKQARELGLEDRVKFLGFMPYDEIPNYLSVGDIFIRPSRSEGFGNSFIEAMVAGLPVIATPVGGIVDFIDDGETGVFCSPDSPQSIVLAVNKIINDDSLRNRIIEKGKDRVVSRYGWDRISKEMTDVFNMIK